MKGSGSAPSDDRSTLVTRWPVILLAAAYLSLHLPFLSPSLEDIDSINFALGLRDYDIAAHQPHPPGYPIFMALGHLSRAVLAVTASSLPQVRAEALALAIWSAIGGAVALVAAWALFRRLGVRAPAARSRSAHVESAQSASAHSGLALWATALLAVAPAFWITGSRPMSDLAGLGLAMTAQALLVGGSRDRRSLVLGAIAAGLAVGIRAQTVWLTFPLLVGALVMQRHAGAVWLLTRPIAALMAAGLSWGVPLLAVSGGLGEYLRALGTQAGEDLAWVDMLLFNPTPRRLAFAFYETFVLPWGQLSVAIPVLVFAAIGFVVMAARERRALAVLAIAFGPYTLFHLLLQETSHVRYAVPVVPALVWLTARGAAPLFARIPRLAGSTWLPAAVAAVPLILLAAFRTVPLGIAYGSEVHPAFRAIDDINREVAGGARPAAVYSHYALRRPVQASPPDGVRVVEPLLRYEWLALVDYWIEGGRAPVWFLSDPKRTDLALIDSRSRRERAHPLVTEYRWSVGDRPELGGARPTGVDWYRFDEPPGWFLAEGWALTPETGGLAKATTMGVDDEPIHGYVRRGRGPMHMVVGVRHLGSAVEPATNFELTIDGLVIEQWTLDPTEGSNLLRFIDLPAGLPPGTGDFAHLSISARSATPGRATPEVAVRQFDIQPADTIVFGFGDGWHEAEYEPATGRQWRWTSERSVLRVAPATAVRLTLRGEWPPSFQDPGPRVRITAAGRVVAEMQVPRAFTWSVSVPADVVAAADGAIAIETDRVYLPGPAEGTEDARHLGLRLFDIEVNTGSP
jgi:hypothetical protein